MKIAIINCSGYSSTFPKFAVINNLNHTNFWLADQNEFKTKPFGSWNINARDQSRAGTDQVWREQVKCKNPSGYIWKDRSVKVNWCIFPKMQV